MKVEVEVTDYDVDQLCGVYKEQGGKLPKEEVAQVLAQHIIDRYFSTEYFDLTEIVQEVGEP